MIIKIITNIYYKFKELLYFKNFDEIKKLKNSKSNKSLFLFGNGKSLNMIDFKKINLYQKNNFDVMATNNFLFSNIYKIVIPNYYVFTDERIIFPKKKYFSNKKKFASKYQEVLIAQNRLEKLNCTIFIPHIYKKRIFKNKTILFNGYINKYSKNFIDVSKARNCFYLTGISALSIACYLGYKKIYICGIDNDQWKNINVNKNNEGTFISSYFYDKKKSKIYFKENIHEFLETWVQIFRSFYKFKNLNIINLDPNSTFNFFKKKHNLNLYK